MLQLAADVAVLRKDRRAFRLGAVACRSDGCIVSSPNGPVTFPDVYAHAEGRLCRKLDRGSVVYVARVGRDGSWMKAMPCYQCLCLMVAKGVKKVYWTELDGFQCKWL